MLSLRPLRYGRIITPARYICGRRFASHRTNVVEELSARGLLQDKTSDNIVDVTNKKATVYLGIDPTGDSLHVGNLLALMTLLHFHIRGHQVIALIGGGTGMIGDPSGRDRERRLLSEPELASNVQAITGQVERFLKRGAAYAAKKSEITEALLEPKVVNNRDWLGEMTMIDFLRIVGKRARVNQMIAKDSVKTRLESTSGISFTEFTYQLLQAYDFYILHRDHGCNIQIGGSDQWGNITGGTSLVRSLTVKGDDGGDEVYGITIPLLTDRSGRKFGKSTKNAVWLKDAPASVFAFYQFFLRLDDAIIERYLRMLSFLPDEEIAELMKWQEKSPELRLPQKRLAEELTELVYGEAPLNRAKVMTQVLYNTNIEELEVDEILAAFEGDPRLWKCVWQDVWRKEVARIAGNHRVSTGHSSAVRTILQGGLYLNNVRVTDPKQKLDLKDFIKKRFAIIRAGMKNHVIIVTEKPPKNHPVWEGRVDDTD